MNDDQVNQESLSPCELEGVDGACGMEERTPQTVERLVERALQKRADATFDLHRRLARVVSADSKGCGCLTEEDDEGDVEYKWRLTNVTPSRFEHLVTQLRFRVREGNGQCLYELGIANDGSPRGLLLHDYQESVRTLQRMAKSLGLDFTILQEFLVQSNPVPLWCGEILMTQRQAEVQDGKIAFCGIAGSGKSTLIGVLLTGHLDDGAGSARQLLFNHKHEIFTGKTTSIVARTLSIDGGEGKSGNNALLQSTGIDGTSRSLAMIDLGGDVTKRMLFGLMSRCPDFTGICISIEQPAEEVVRYAQLCRAMHFPFFVVVTKLDLALDIEIDAFLLELAVELSSVGCDSVLLVDVDGVDSFQRLWKQSNQVPVLRVSSADGSGIELFKHFIASLPTGAMPVTPDRKFEVLLDGSFFVHSVGPVVRGHVASGSVELGCHCRIGPDLEGKFYPVVVQGIHVGGSHVTRVRPPDEATFALSDLPSSVDMTQKGKLLISTSVEVFWAFEARIKVLSRGITPRLQPILYTSNMRQAVRIIPPFPKEAAAFDKGCVVRFQFLYHPEVLREGASVILQWNPEGIAVGEVITLFSRYQPPEVD
ncbi:putative GTP-binding protein [Trypanosoma rangeli]|uniref:Putative GTP-binding protein n=1 Tax=Trypanosoma rangeli TaxID=5698 RepID=A0A3R7MTY6_TRYRA|nr:putative GTP-binding protein [Trypanosoma rangeli]RNF11176.1 putative GTP-binding protein [Trypanosoma rangeli]|eukprot:RNF11176.1 putative GTP-binding protein [Trypanosoma rangeli]